MTIPLIVPGAEPFFFPGGKTGCLLLHGFTCMPEEMRGLGGDLAQLGYTVLGLRLPGHATHPHDLNRVRSTDFLIAVEEGLALLRESTQHVVLIGQSLGGVLALLAAARYPITGVIAMACPSPYAIPPIRQWLYRIAGWLRLIIRKSEPHAHPTLGIRREAGYPAYMEYPARVFWELFKIQKMMKEALPQIRVPGLVIHSKDDPMAPAAGAQRIYDGLGSPDKALVWLEGFGHGIVFHPCRQEVVEPIAGFITRITAGDA
jgi:carboxylesterase